MRLVTYTRDGHTGVGIRLPDGIAPIGGYATMLDLIAAGQPGLDAAARAADASERLADASIAAPLRGSSKLLFSGVNFITHILEH
ncbi:MAG TPA: hypothetical protein VFL91_17880, partial [Thermomicrobiales bacterium]|nr:hypothetical protein [Thermomicrobiales bacterium]